MANMATNKNLLVATNTIKYDEIATNKNDYKSVSDSVSAKKRDKYDKNATNKNEYKSVSAKSGLNTTPSHVWTLLTKIC